MKCVLTPSSALTLTSFVTSRAEDKPYEMLVFLCSKCYSIVWNGSLHQCSNLDLFVEFAHVRDVSSFSSVQFSSQFYFNTEILQHVGRSSRKPYTGE